MTKPIELSTGERIAQHRARRGWSQSTFGAMIDRSENWVWKVENGSIPVDSFSLLLQIQRVLGLRDLAELTGHPLALTPNSLPQHDSAGAIHAALLELPMTRGEKLPLPVLTVDGLRRRVLEAQDIYDRDKARYARLGGELPTLLGQAHRTVRAAAGEDALTATRSLVEVYHLLQVFLKRIGEPEDARLAADRALAYASETGNLELVGASVWNLGAVLLNRGEGDAAVDVARSMIGMMTPIPDDATPAYISVYGALHLVAVIGYARDGKSSRGWEMLREADRIAGLLPGDRNDYRTSFGPTNVRMHACHLAGEDANPADVLRLADDVDLSSPVLPIERVTRFLMELLNASRMQRDDVAMLYMLKRIMDISPDEIKYFPTAREAARDLLGRTSAIYREDVRIIAEHIGATA